MYCLRTFLATHMSSSRFLAISSKLGGKGKFGSVVADPIVPPTVEISLCRKVYKWKMKSDGYQFTELAYLSSSL